MRLVAALRRLGVAALLGWLEQSESGGSKPCQNEAT